MKARLGNDRRLVKFGIIIFSGFIFIRCFVLNVQAFENPEQRYNRLIAIASKHVDAKKLQAIPTSRFSLEARSHLKLDDKFFTVGQTWSMKFIPKTHGGVSEMTRRVVVGENSTADYKNWTASIFDFRVLDVESGGVARIEVRERAVEGTSLSDPQVDHYILTMNRNFDPTRKEIFFRNGRESITLQMNANQTFFTGFSAAPVEIPNLNLDDGVTAKDSQGKDALRFDVSDTYARPITVFWRTGETWPSEILTTAGKAQLNR